MSNVKSLAEDIIQLANSSNRLDEVIHLLKSSENTLVDDVKALLEGAKLECKVDVKNILRYIEEIDNCAYSAEDDISSVHSYIDDAIRTIGSLQDEINGLRRYIEELSWEKEEEDSK